MYHILDTGLFQSLIGFRTLHVVLFGVGAACRGLWKWNCQLTRNQWGWDLFICNGTHHGTCSVNETRSIKDTGFGTANKVFWWGIDEHYLLAWVLVLEGWVSLAGDVEWRTAMWDLLPDNLVMDRVLNKFLQSHIVVINWHLKARIWHYVVRRTFSFHPLEEASILNFKAYSVMEHFPFHRWYSWSPMEESPAGQPKTSLKRETKFWSDRVTGLLWYHIVLAHCRAWSDKSEIIKDFWQFGRESLVAFLMQRNIAAGTHCSPLRLTRVWRCAGETMGLTT